MKKVGIHIYLSSKAYFLQKSVWSKLFSFLKFAPCEIGVFIFLSDHKKSLTAVEVLQVFLGSLGTVTESHILSQGESQLGSSKNIMVILEQEHYGHFGEMEKSRQKLLTYVQVCEMRHGDT